MASDKKFGTVPEWCAASGMSRSGTYDAANRGGLVIVRIGGKSLVDFEQGFSWLRSLPRVGASPARRYRHPPLTAATSGQQLST